MQFEMNRKIRISTKFKLLLVQKGIPSILIMVIGSLFTNLPKYKKPGYLFGNPAFQTSLEFRFMQRQQFTNSEPWFSVPRLLGVWLSQKKFMSIVPLNRFLEVCQQENAEQFAGLPVEPVSRLNRSKNPDLFSHPSTIFQTYGASPGEIGLGFHRASPDTIIMSYRAGRPTPVE